MASEIEYKYLVNHKKWELVNVREVIEMKQGYINSDPEKTIRIRTTNNSAYITIKGKAKGAVRAEYEYEIPKKDGLNLLHEFCDNLIVKSRHLVDYKGKVWEVDVFEGDNKGLITAEIELDSEDEEYEIPDWIEEDVTSDYRYSNSTLSLKPYKYW